MPSALTKIPVVRDWLGSLIRWWERTRAELAAVGPRSALAQRFGAFGSGAALLYPLGSIYNEHYIRLGAGSIIGPNVALAVGMAPGQTMASDPVITIGARTMIGRGSHIV